MEGKFLINRYFDLIKYVEDLNLLDFRGYLWEMNFWKIHGH